MIKSPRLQGLLGLLWCGYEVLPKRFIYWRLDPQLVVALRSWLDHQWAVRRQGLPGGTGSLEIRLWRVCLVLEHFLLALYVSWLSQVSGFLSPCHSLMFLSCLKQWILLTVDWNHWKPRPTMIILPYADFSRYFCHRKRRLINTRTDFLNSLSLTLPMIV